MSFYQKSALNETRIKVLCTFAVLLVKFIHQYHPIFSAQNMGHNQLQKCTKYHLVSLLNEKQGSTVANFLHFFYPVTLLTNSALDVWHGGNKHAFVHTFSLGGTHGYEKKLVLVEVFPLCPE